MLCCAHWLKRPALRPAKSDFRSRCCSETCDCKTSGSGSGSCRSTLQQEPQRLVVEVLRAINGSVAKLVFDVGPSPGLQQNFSHFLMIVQDSQMERGVTGRVADILVCLRLCDQEIHHSTVSRRDSRVEWSVAFLVCGIHVSTSLSDEEVDDGKVALLGCHVEWSVTINVNGIHIRGCLGQKKLHNIPVPLLSSPVEGQPSH
mmetsp:Transcript_68229/g.142595  ORF Transcript_68229/g.142595 Transcript_68229/m.142595 type:complete len:202 (+) Transcript_68229:201-806(+)